MSAIAYQRLARQHIAPPPFAHPAEAVAWMGVMQGQDYSGAKWSVGLRLSDATDAQIEAALTEKSILRTWLLRGTLFLVAAADLGWIRSLVAPRLLSGQTRRYKELELDEATRNRGADIIARAVEGGQTPNRDAIFALLEENGIAAKGARGYHLLHYASLNGLVCQTTAPRNVPSFTTPPEGKALQREEACAELARRYFRSHGPATLADFMWWSGLAANVARAGLAAVQSELAEVVESGQTYWTAEAAPPRSYPDVILLPGFDEYLLGYKERSAVLPPQYARRVAPGGNGVFFPTIVSRGQVVGTWKRDIKKAGLTLIPAPFEGLSAAEEEGFAGAARRYADYLQLPMG